MLEAYRKHVEERAAEGVVAQPLNAEQVAALIELLKNPPQGEDAVLLDLLENRIPPGVDEAAYVKAGFLAAITTGEAQSSLVTKAKAAQLLGTMQGGYNIEPLVSLLDDAELAPIAVTALSHTLLMFDSFYDVEQKLKRAIFLLSKSCNRGRMPSGSYQSQPLLKKLLLPYLKSVVKPILMTYHQRQMHGHALIFRCTH